MVASKKVEALSGKNPPALGQPLPLTVPLSLAGGNIKANSISQSNINEWMYKHLAWLIYQSVECRALMFDVVWSQRRRKVVARQVEY